VGLFPDATVFMQKAEYDAAYGPDAEQLTYLPETYAALVKDRIQTIVGDYDVFGDGRVVMKSLPGHTPGHQGLLITLRRIGPILLAADIAYSAQDYADTVLRNSNFDIEQTRQSIEAVKEMEREFRATVWLHHDLDAQRHIRLSPIFYE
jgi:glyoxylase-like metal-dependent hydrolase (beta-lactamase superfamily II)